MGQKYQVDNLTSRFIKSLLWDTYIPTVGIWKPGKALIKGLTYITDDKYIVRAQKSFDLYTDKDVQIVWKRVEKSELISKINSHNKSYFKIIEPYIEGKFYPGITSNLKSNSSLYDSDTHYMLGQYLRMLRDLHNLDLMPYYNCFDGTTSDKIRINRITKENDGQEISIDELITNNNLDDGFISYIVPIKFNNDYTIYYNSEVPFRIKPVYYDGINIFPLYKTSNNDEIQSTLVRRCSTLQPYVFNSIDFKTPFISTENARCIEDYLCLLIQVPNYKLSNLVVLEGNYKGTNINNYNNINSVSKILYGDSNDVLKLSQEDTNSILKQYSSLTYKNIGVNYAFSDRLLEYLLLSPIINKDKIKNNIWRIQRYLTSNKAIKEFGNKYPYEYKKDIWDNLLRLYIYNLVIRDKKNPLYLDINGFVDKDSEFIIDRGKESGGNLDV